MGGRDNTIGGPLLRICAALSLVVLIGTGVAWAGGGPCDPLPRCSNTNQEEGRRAQLSFEDGGLFVEMWGIREEWTDGDIGGKGHFQIWMRAGSSFCSAELNPERDVLEVDPDAGTATLRSFEPGCEASVEWDSTGIPGAGASGGSSVSPELAYVSAGAAITRTSRAVVTGTMFGETIPPGADGEITYWQGRGVDVGL